MDRQNEWIEIPILQALEKHQSVERTSLHVPGHKAGRGLYSDFAKYAGSLARLDATELPGLDDLHHPQEVIAEAQRLASAAWGSDDTFFLVNGSTVGNLVAVMSVVTAGDTVIVGRDAHQSIWHALALAKVKVIAVTPSYVGMLIGSVRTFDIEAAMNAYPEAVAVIITSPTYHGIVSDLFSIVKIAHAKNMTVIVDEAHGAHLAFHPDLPPSAVSAKADLVVQSAHKMTAAFTQTGLLHVNGDNVDLETVRYYLRVFQTSSPSYLFLASLDAARAQLVADGKELLGEAMQFLTAGKALLSEEFPGLINGGFADLPSDPFKWTIWSGQWGVSGEHLARAFAASGIFVELYDTEHALLVWSFANSVNDMERVIKVIQKALRGKLWRIYEKESLRWDEAMPRLTEVWPSGYAKNISKLGELDQLVNKKAAQAITLCPPGIPLVLPDEVYTSNMIQYIKKCIEFGLRVDGLVNSVEGRAWFLNE